MNTTFLKIKGISQQNTHTTNNCKFNIFQKWKRHRYHTIHFKTQSKRV